MVGNTAFLQNERLIFMHVEKTAGTAIHQALSSLFNPTEICPERSARIAEWPAAALSSFRFFSAHAALSDFAEVPGPTRTLTFLRDPTERSLSLYEYWQSLTDAVVAKHNLHGPRLARCLPPLAFFNARNNWRCRATDGHSSMLLGETTPRDASSWPEPTERAQRAIARLEQLDFVGISEDLEGSVDRMSAWFDIPRLTFDKQANVTSDNYKVDPDKFKPSPPTDLSEQVLEMIYAGNAADQIVYDHAVNKLYGEVGLVRRYRGIRDEARTTVRKQRAADWVENLLGGFVLYGPYARLRPGTYVATFTMRVRPGSDGLPLGPLGHVDAVSRAGTTVLSHRPFDVTDVNSSGIDISFELPEMVNDLELRVFVSSSAPLDVNAEVTLRKSGTVTCR